MREAKHYSNIYYGSSISALDFLAKKKGYSLVGSNKAGNNVFFIRDDLMKNFKKLLPKDAYIASQFREARNEENMLTFSSIKDNLDIISDLEVINVETKEVIKIKQLF